MIFDEFKALRIRRGETQADFCRRAGVSKAQVSRLEAGSAMLSTVQTLAKNLKIRVEFVGLPDGGSLGERVRSLRNSRGISQLELVKLAGVSHPSVINLELDRDLHMKTVLQILLALGVTARLG